MVPELDETPEGVLLPLQAQPKSRKNQIVCWHAGRLKVQITQAPEKGKANQALIRLLAKLLGIKRSQIELVSGDTSPLKLFRIEGLSAEELLSRVSDAAEESS